MAQELSHRPLTAETRVRSQASQCEIGVGPSDTGTGFSPSTPVSPVRIIPSMLRTHLSVLVAVTRDTNWRSLGTWKKGRACRKLGNIV